MNEQQPRLLIALLGGRIQPAAMAARQLRPDAIACVVSSDSEQRVQAMETFVRQFLPDCRWGGHRLVDAYDLSATRVAIGDLMAHNPAYSTTISLASGAAPMILGAYDIARQLHLPALYTNTRDGILVNVAQDSHAESMTIDLSVIDYLAAYGFVPHAGWPLKSAEQIPQRHIAALTLLLNNLHAAHHLLPWLDASHRKTGPFTKQAALTQSAWQLLLDLLALDLIQSPDGPLNRSRPRLQISRTEDKNFLGGDWLEILVLHTARQLQVDSRSLFDACEMGLHFVDHGQAERELDFLGTVRGRLVAASCKTSAKKTWPKEWLDDLAGATSNIGGRFCTLLLVTNMLRPAQGVHSGSYDSFCEYAHKAHVVVVPGNDLGRLPALLKKEVLAPTYPPR